MLNRVFCLAVMSLLAHLWVRGEKICDVESDTQKKAPSIFVLGFSVGQVGACFHIQAGFPEHADLLHCPRGAAPKAAQQGPLSMQQQQPLAQAGMHLSSSQLSESTVVQE